MPNVPAIFWHCYPHPDRRPWPDDPASTPVAAWPSWYLRAECACGHCGYLSLLYVQDQAQTIGRLAARAACRKCGARPTAVSLVTTCLETAKRDEVVVSRSTSAARGTSA